MFKLFPRKKTTHKQGTEFSKALLIQESILVWIVTIAFVILAFLSIQRDFLGELSWLAALCPVVWAAYGISQGFYYNKAKSENIKGGVKYLAVANKLGIIENDNELIDEELEDQSCAEG